MSISVIQDVSEVCASRVPTKQEDALGSCTLERISRMGDIMRILTKEIGVSKSAEAAARARVVEANDVKRALEEHRSMLQKQIAGVELEAPDSDREVVFKKAFFVKMRTDNTEALSKAATAIKEAEANSYDWELKVKLKQQELSAITDEWNHLRAGGRPGGLHPWPMFYPIVAQEEEVGIITITLCSFCRFAFPNHDIVVAGCKHLYHPWCAYSVFGKGNKCVQKNCGATVHPSWYQSFGWGIPSAELEQEGLELDIDVQLLQCMHEREEALKVGRPRQENQDKGKQPLGESSSKEMQPVGEPRMKEKQLENLSTTKKESVSKDKLAKEISTSKNKEGELLTSKEKVHKGKQPREVVEEQRLSGMIFLSISSPGSLSTVLVLLSEYWLVHWVDYSMSNVCDDGIYSVRTSVGTACKYYMHIVSVECGIVCI